ncbi:MAG: FHA domain-containing protein [Desulfatitalea sp.]|nr:FHA domain-containing protein [Desulfatitalea sp.]
MTTIPHIIVQLVHIQGPLKGDIQELADSEIRIGRHPDCQVRFAKDEVTLSRIHARIVREGNRFKIIDQSTNGTFVNGLRLQEAYLKDGDVLMFAEGGPKVSFLTQTISAPPSDSGVTAERPQPPPPQPPAARPAPPTPPAIPLQPPPVVPSTPGPTAASVKVPLAIQYGPALKSFTTLPVVLGKGAGCDFVIDHPAVSDRHAQIFFDRDQYWIRDLTGNAAVSIDGRPPAAESALSPDMVVALSAQGPRFRFLGGGRLVEIEGPPPAAPGAEDPPHGEASRSAAGIDGAGKKGSSLFKKLFS